MMRTTILACLLLVTGAEARAQQQPDEAVVGYQSAAELLRKCRSSSSHGKSYCFAYLAAVADAARAYQTWLGVGDPCLPNSLSQGELADLFEGFVIANPTLVKAQAASVIVFALQERFPCGEQPKLPYEPVDPVDRAIR